MANEKRLIDANALFDELIKRQYYEQTMGFVASYYPHMRAIVANAPTVDAVEVVHGRWARKQIGKYTGADEVCCSVCGCWIGVVSSDTGFREAIEGMNYCPNCGAKMDGSADNEID